MEETFEQGPASREGAIVAVSMCDRNDAVTQDGWIHPFLCENAVYFVQTMILQMPKWRREISDFLVDDWNSVEMSQHYKKWGLSNMWIRKHSRNQDDFESENCSFLGISSVNSSSGCWRRKPDDPKTKNFMFLTDMNLNVVLETDIVWPQVGDQMRDHDE